jgi:hypothetical protein
MSEGRGGCEGWLLTKDPSETLEPVSFGAERELFDKGCQAEAIISSHIFSYSSILANFLIEDSYFALQLNLCIFTCA